MGKHFFIFWEIKERLDILAVIFYDINVKEINTSLNDRMIELGMMI